MLDRSQEREQQNRVLEAQLKQQQEAKAEADRLIQSKMEALHTEKMKAAAAAERSVGLRITAVPVC